MQSLLLLKMSKTHNPKNPHVFLDITIGGTARGGRMVFELFADIVPKTAGMFDSGVGSLNKLLSKAGGIGYHTWFYQNSALYSCYYNHSFYMRASNSNLFKLPSGL